MSVERKKISMDRFQRYSRQVINFVNRRGVEVVVYNDEGAVARLLPYAAGPMGVTRSEGVRPMDMGGVWYIDEETRDSLDASKRKKGLFHRFSLGGVWKLARVSAILPFFTRA